MDRITLTEKELMVLASSVGAIRLYGIDNPFRAAGKDEIRDEIPEIQRSLENRGYVTLTFDGKCLLNSSVKSLVEICALCEGYIVLDQRTEANLSLRKMIYCRDQQFAALRKCESNLVELYLLTEEQAMQFIDENIHECRTISSQDVKYMLNRAELEDVKTLDAVKGTSTLTEKDYPLPIANCLIGGLKGELPYCSVMAVRLKKHRYFANLNWIKSADGNLRFMKADAENEDLWNLCWTSAAELKNDFCEMVRHIVSEPKEA